MIYNWFLQRNMNKKIGTSPLVLQTKIFFSEHSYSTGQPGKEEFRPLFAATTLIEWGTLRHQPFSAERNSL